MFNKNSEQPLPGDQRTPSDNQILHKLAQEYAKELKWRRIFKFLILGFFILYLISAAWFAAGGPQSAVTRPHTAVVELSGPIGLDPGVTAQQINLGLQRAFEASQSQAVILKINSPGGSPVQSAEINSEMVRLKELYPSKPLHVVIGELCASGGYYVAVGADNIVAHPSSIVGSIGVRMDSFGFVDAMDKLGIERRLLTAGESKGALDPFSPLSQTDVNHVRRLLRQIQVIARLQLQQEQAQGK